MFVDSIITVSNTNSNRRYKIYVPSYISKRKGGFLVYQFNLLKRRGGDDDDDDSDDTTYSDTLDDFEDGFSDALDPTQDEDSA